MDHLQAQTTKATERYLLGEMSELERFAFESHYFDCKECADDVRAAHALAAGVKAVCSEEPVAPRVHTAPSAGAARWWAGWWTPALAAAVGILAVYQGFVLIPGLRQQMESRAMAPIVLLAAKRGPEQPIEMAPDESYRVVQLDVNVDPDTPLQYSLVAPGGAVRVSSPTKAPPLGSSLFVTLWRRDLNRPGIWTLVLRDSKNAIISSYPFNVPK